eukprot:gene20524-26620_t
MSVNYSISPDGPIYSNKPYINGSKILINGEVIDWSGQSDDVTSPIIDQSTGQRTVIGKIAHLGETEAINAVLAAKAAWNTGTGEWPQKSIEQLDAAAEFDRTVLFIEAIIAALREGDIADGQYRTISGIQAKVRRAAIGVMLALGPFNYPFNETYTTTIPALLMGNTIVMKIPTVGGFAHVLTMEAYAKSFPKGVVNFISGPGRETMGPAIRQGVDLFAFIGSSKAADVLLQDHPHPHRLKTFLSLEGKNLGIVTEDADLDIASEQITLGSTAFNGQRCTAIKMTFVHKSVASDFLNKLKVRFAGLKAGLPFEQGVLITPLPEPNKIEFLNSLIDDAKSKGAAIINADNDGGNVYGNIFVPAIVYPVTESQRLWHEEQFGPIVPVAVYSHINEVIDYIAKMPYGQQAAIFSTKSETIAPLIDILSTAVGRININTQCGRSPDAFPFSGRRSSALGTLSVTESLKAFSTETVIAAKSSDLNNSLLVVAESISNFLAPVL